MCVRLALRVDCPIIINVIGFNLLYTMIGTMMMHVYDYEYAWIVMKCLSIVYLHLYIWLYYLTLRFVYLTGLGSDFSGCVLSTLSRPEARLWLWHGNRVYLEYRVFMTHCIYLENEFISKKGFLYT
jgi:hypothetical protein